MRRLTSDDYTVMPWKNGGGTTTQLAIHPPAAGIEDFDWRISTAQVASDGPFSAFPGVDRSLAVVHGHGLVLTDGSGERRRLGEGAQPFVFPGEASIEASLKGGPVTDINVMTRRASCTHRLELMELQGTLRCVPGSDLLLVYLARGGRMACQGADGSIAVCSEGDALLIDWRNEPEIELAALSPAVLCLAHITYKESRHE